MNAFEKEMLNLALNEIDECNFERELCIKYTVELVDWRVLNGDVDEEFECELIAKKHNPSTKELYRRHRKADRKEKEKAKLRTQKYSQFTCDSFKQQKRNANRRVRRVDVCNGNEYRKCDRLLSLSMSL